jgi:hypothetical protein
METAMQRDQVFSVVGLRENGDRVVIATETTRKTAEQIVSLMTAGTGFAELFIASAGDGELQHSGYGSDASGDLVGAGTSPYPSRIV